MATPAALPPWDFTVGTCCKRQDISTMDSLQHHPSNWENPTRFVRRVCVICFARWEGPVGNVRHFTRREWDAYLATLQKTNP